MSIHTVPTADPVDIEFRERLDDFKQHLEERGVRPGEAVKQGFDLLSRAETEALVGNSNTSCGRAAIAITYPNLDGKPTDFVRLRFLGKAIGFKPSKEQKRAPRFWQKPGTEPHAYLPRLLNGCPWRDFAADPTAELYVTEGEIKAMAMANAGFPAIGLGGVHSWHVAGDEDTPVEGLREVDVKGRNVAIVYDYDPKPKTQRTVRRAARKLSNWIKSRGGVPRIVNLPPPENGAKQGVDDFLVAQGRDELVKLISDATEGRLPDALNTGGYLLDTKFPPLAFAIDPYFPKGELVEFHGPHGQFKSTLMLYAALSVATGEPWHTRAFATRGRAVFISLEDREATLSRRVKCWLAGPSPLYQKVADGKRRTKEERAKLEEGIRRNFRCLGREQAAPLTLTETDYGAAIIRTTAVDRIVSLCGQDADLIVLETATRLHPGEESNEALAVLARALEFIATRTGACVVLIRHVSKEQAERARKGKGVTSYAGRGGGSLADAGRGVLSAGRLSDKLDAPIMVAHTKANLTARGPTLWWRVDSTPLGPYLSHIEAPAQKEEQKADHAGRVLDVIRAAGKAGIGARDLQRKLPSGADPAELRAAIKQLVADKRVTETKEARGRVVYRIAYVDPPTGGRP